MRPHQDWLGGIDLAHHQHQMLGVIDQVAIDERAELAERGRQLRFRDSLDHRLVAQAILDDIGDGDYLEPVHARELDQVVAPRHGSVFLQNFADDAGRLQTREPRKIHRAFSLPGAHQHAAVARTQRIDVAGRDELGAARVFTNRRKNCDRAVLRRDSRARRAARSDRSRERGAERSLVVADHHAEPEPVDPLRRHRQANEAAPELRHEVDRLGGGFFRRHAQVALIFALLIVHHDDHVAATSFLERFLDRNERRAGFLAGTYFTKHLIRRSS